mgnify:CR=1 FL=1
MASSHMIHLCEEGYILNTTWFFIFFPEKTPSISYKILQMRVLLCGCSQTQERERTTIVGWRLVVVFQLYRSHSWGHRIGSLEWLQLHSISLALTLLDARFGWRRPVCIVIYMIESKELLRQHNLRLIGVEWILRMVEKITSCAFITKVIPFSWFSYLSIGACHDNQHTFPHLIVPCTWHNCNRWPTPRHIWWVFGQPHNVCRIDSVAFGHATQLGELRFSHCQAPTGSELCIITIEMW